MNVRDFSVDHHRGGSVEPRDQERAMPPERPRSAHLERVYMSVNGVMGYDEQVRACDTLRYEPLKLEVLHSKSKKQAICILYLILEPALLRLTTL